MPTNYVLIDYKNVQPKNLEILSSHLFKGVRFYRDKPPQNLINAREKFIFSTEHILKINLSLFYL